MKRISAAIVGLCCSAHALAQDESNPARTTLTQAPQATLPEIEVRPPATDSNTNSPSDTNLSPSVGSSSTSAFDNGAYAGNSYNGPGSSLQNPIQFGEGFPSLSGQSIGGGASNPTGLNSVLRGESDLFDMPQMATIVDRETLDRRQSTNMFRALQNEVGVLLQQTGNGQLSPFIRGLTGQQILVLVDGIRMNTSILRPGPNQYTATIDPGMIDHIEIIRGSQSALWGSDAIGGVINVVTRSADPLRGDYGSPMFSQYWSSAEASSYTRTGFGGWYGDTGIIGGVSYLDVGQLDRGGGLGRQPATDYQQYAADIKVNRMLGTDHMLTVALQHFEQQNLARSDRFLPFVLGPAPNGSVPTQRPSYFDPQQRDLGYLRFEGLIDEELLVADAYSITFSGTRTKEGSIVDRYSSNSPAAQPTLREIGEFNDWGWGTIVSFSKDTGDFGQIYYGADFYDENIDAVRNTTSNPNNPASVPKVADPQYPDDSQADRVGTYLAWSVPLTDRLDFDTAVRYENINMSGTPNFSGIGPLHFDRTYQDWVANGSLSYLLVDDVRLVGGVYEGFRAPTIDDLTANKTSLQNSQSVPLLGNLAAQPEHSLTYEVGFKVNKERWRMQIMEYWIDFDSFLSRQSINNVDFLTNQTAFINGTELNGEYLLASNISLYGNFYYTYGQQTTTNAPLSRIPPTQGILGMRFNMPTTRSYFDVYTWLVRRADRYDETNLSDVRFIPGGTPGYATLNARAGRAFGKTNQNQVSLSLENITDKYYRVLGSGVDGTGFNAVLGYQYTY
jgi:iron complex outermembrane receptor protein/hemoglobin/transferrin/lactoferrin receptor protein